MSAKTLSEIKKQEKELESQSEALIKQEEQIEKDLKEHQSFDKAINLALAENNKLSAEVMISSLESGQVITHFNNYFDIFEKLMSALESLIKIDENQKLNRKKVETADDFFRLYWVMNVSSNLNRTKEVLKTFKEIRDKYPQADDYIMKNNEALISNAKTIKMNMNINVEEDFDNIDMFSKADQKYLELLQDFLKKEIMY